MHPHSILTFRVQVGALAKVHPRFLSSLPAKRLVALPFGIRTRHSSIPARLTMRQAMMLAGIVINCSRDDEANSAPSEDWKTESAIE